MTPPIGPATRLCMSIAARPGTFGSRFHNHLYEALGLDYVYKAFQPTDLEGAVGAMRALGIRGCGVSMPYKEAVIPMLDALEPSAAVIDSVNTIVNDDGRLTGFNTDYSAVRTLIEEAGLAGTRFILRGSGGMAKATVAALRDAGLHDGIVVSRNEATGRAICVQYGFGWSAELGDLTAPLLVNVTPLGMRGDNADTLAFPERAIAAAGTVFDVVAVPPETPLLRAAGRMGKRVITGQAVSALQALEQFVLYTGVRPSPEQVDTARAYAAG